MIIIALAAGPARAELSPRDYDQLAAQATVIIIGRVAKTWPVGRAGIFTGLVTSLEVLAVRRGQVKPGARVRVEFALWHERLLPTGACYYSRRFVKPGRIFLLFVAPGFHGKGLRLAAHGCRVKALDGPRRAVLKQLGQATAQVHLKGRLRSRLRSAYKWAAAWVRKQRGKR